MGTLVAIAWRNLLRNTRRSLLTALAMGIAVAFLMTMLALLEGFYGQIRDVLVTRSLGHVQVHHPDWPGKRQLLDGIDDVDAVVAALEADPAVARVAPRLYGNALLGGEDRTEGAQIVGVDPLREDAIRGLAGDVTEGTWLPASPSRAMVLGYDLARRLEVGVGDEVLAVTQAADGSLGNDLYRVAGLVRTGTPSIDKAGAFLDRADLAELLVLPGRAHEIVVVGRQDDRDATTALAASVGRDLGGRTALVRPWWDVDPVTAQLFAMQEVSTWIMIVFFYGISAVGVVNTLLMSVFERTRELGVMRAIGLRPRQVVLLVVLEALMLAVLAIAVGGALGAVGDAVLVTHGVDFSIGGKGYEVGDMTFDPIVFGRVSAASVWQPIVGVLLFTLLAATWPAVRAARLRPVTAMREG